jgi:hypothetical protein
VVQSLKTIKAVGSEGAGNGAAAKAWKVLAKSGNAALLPTLEAFDGATPTVANWLRSVVSAIANEAEQNGRKLSKDDLLKFVLNPKQAPAARRLAFELVEKMDAKAAQELLPNFLNDPQLDLRRDAVAAEMKRIAPLANRDNLRREYAALLLNARDEDQIKEIAKQLKENGTEVNLTKHYGFITEWLVSPTFDNKDGVGFALACDPETKADRTEWKYIQSNDPGGMVDINKVYGEKKNLVAYASATVIADEDVMVELRAASQNAVKMFVNGKEVYFREEYHSGVFLDQHIAAVKLNKGKNEILMKVCQNDLNQPWAKAWGFSARLSDSTGLAVRLKQSITKDGKEAIVEFGELAPPDPKPEKKEEK